MRTDGDKQDKTGPNEVRWGQMGHNGVNQGQSSTIGAKLGKLGQTGYNGANLGQTRPKGAKWCQRVSNGVNGAKQE